VVVNLVVNARDALEPGGGTITVATGKVELSPDAAVDRDVAPGAYVSLSIADDGCGMDEATRQRALEPFFSTKAPGTGTGLGLATVAGIASEAGGWVAIDAEPGTGTTVRVNLPAVSEVEPVGLG
jgi:signal transduction histidine kinase